MADAIRFVHGDTLPQLKLSITDSVANAPVNLTNYAVYMYIRPSASTQDPIRTMSTAAGNITKSNQTTNPGECIVIWGPNDLKLATSMYEAEIELVGSTGSRETIYDLLSFYVRGEIGPVPLSNDYVAV